MERMTLKKKRAKKVSLTNQKRRTARGNQIPKSPRNLNPIKKRARKMKWLTFNRKKNLPRKRLLKNGPAGSLINKLTSANVPQVLSVVFFAVLKRIGNQPLSH
jgi:hypothetical protein